MDSVLRTSLSSDKSTALTFRGNPSDLCPLMSLRTDSRSSMASHSLRQKRSDSNVLVVVLGPLQARAPGSTLPLTARSQQPCNACSTDLMLVGGWGGGVGVEGEHVTRCFWMCGAGVH